eukprot:CAMPEP_0197016180 /NCGR_PEP_ID=MMETSP1380-20130617/77239_1 /TAXON_ID=5936 /ORGANISM="Euplotes crassus, Strain CT5" /LENGTH=154 /DNA_ID=CAMNT_0042442733 /DNA_START=6 /DNA_END=466 /DNA_ORIENTATION=+
MNSAMDSRSYSNVMGGGSMTKNSSSMEFDRESIEKLANQMPMLDRVILGPLKKFQKYNHFPYKLVAHILLMIICTAQVILVIGSSGSYSRSQQNLFYRLFLDDEFESEDPATEKIVHEFSLTEFSGKVRTYLDNYYSLGEEVNDYFEDYKLVAP